MNRIVFDKFCADHEIDQWAHRIRQLHLMAKNYEDTFKLPCESEHEQDNMLKLQSNIKHDCSDIKCIDDLEHVSDCDETPSLVYRILGESDAEMVYKYCMFGLCVKKCPISVC